MKVFLLASTTWTGVTGLSQWDEWGNSLEATSLSSEILTEFAGRLCYQSFHRPNPSTRLNKDYIRNILQQEHYSVIEHGGFSVAVIEVSRAFSHEIVRHRHLSVSQLSQRFVSEERAQFILPPLFIENQEAEEIFREVRLCTLHAYERLLKLADSKLSPNIQDKSLRRKRAREASRYVLPNAVETQLVLSGNHRTWRDIFEKRGGQHVDQEMREVILQIFDIAVTLAPALYQDFHKEPLLEGSAHITILKKEGDRRVD